MYSNQEQSAHETGGEPPPHAAVSRPKIGLSELVLQLWRAKWLMLLVFLPLFALGVFAATRLPETYQAYSRIQVSLGREYVYEPLIGDAGKGAVLESEAVVRAEVEKVYSPTIARRVLAKVGLENIYPDLAEASAEADTTEERGEAQSAALQALQTGFSAGAAPKSPVIRLSFQHEDPEVAAEVVNAFVDEFLAYRIELASDTMLDSVRRQRSEFDANLTDAEHAVRAFLIKHRIGDFEGERSALSARHAAISDEIFKVEASRQEAEARLAVLERELAQTPEEIELYIDTTGDEQLLNLQIEREQLLSRYRPDSQPVRDVEARIANLRQLLQSSEGGVRRRGQNPSFIELDGAVSVQRAELDALRSRASELKRQLTEVETRQLQMIDLLPEYQRLLREQSVLETSVKTLAEREQSRRAESRLNEETTSLTVLERAEAPSEGSSLKVVAAAAALMFSAFTAFMAGLAWALTRSGLATRGSAERTLDLPVLGAVQRRSA